MVKFGVRITTMAPRPQGNEDLGDTIPIPDERNRPLQLQEQRLVRAIPQPQLAPAEPIPQQPPLDGQPPPPNQRLFLAIQDEAEWLRRYGLNGEPHYGADSYANQQEAKQRVQAQEDYQAQIHAILFEGQTPADQRRNTQLDNWSNQIVKIVTATGPAIECNLKYLAASSDTVFTMAETRPHFETDETKPLLLSLSEYSHEGVWHFLNLLNQHAKSDVSFQPKEHLIVECCQIACYLQCNALLDDVLVPLLVQSVDSANCLSLCQLADQLNLPALLEASVNHMIQRLGSVEDDEIWADLTPELQDRIHDIQHILQSTNRRQLFFSSFDEYLALFAEQVDYYKERLDDAIHQQSQHPEQSPSWLYAQSKIDQQRERVRILNLVLQEHKRLFRRHPI